MNWAGAIFTLVWGVIAIVLRRPIVRRIKNSPSAGEFYFGERAILVVGILAILASPVVLVLTPSPG